MKRLGVCGLGTGINGRVAAMQATQRALDSLGASRPVFALAFAALEFNMAEVQAGLGSLLGDTPLWGFSTLRPLTAAGDQPRSVVVALLAGADNHAVVKWFAGDSQDGAGSARMLAQALRQQVFLPPHVLVAADGFDNSLERTCEALSEMEVGLTGCMASGDLSVGRTIQLGGNQFGPGGLSAAFLGGRFRAGVGIACGWRDLGVYFRVTRARGAWLHELDGKPALEALVSLFSFPARDWALPPLSDMLRLYPLRVERPSAGRAVAELSTPDIRSILRVEVDGSLRMGTPVPEGAVVHLMSGDSEACLQAAQDAAHQALNSLEPGARPLLAVAFADAAWSVLFETRPKALSEAVSAGLDTAHRGLPLVGAYTFGQLARPVIEEPPVLQNHSLVLLVIGEAQE